MKDIESNCVPTAIPKVNLKKNITVTPEVAWKDNLLIFENTRFEDMVVKLERWYNVSISVEGKDSLEDRFTLTIRHESLKEVLDLISLTTKFDYSIDENKVKITYK